MSGKTLEEIRRAGLEVLARELGPLGMVRFLQQFETGCGDYSVDRHSWLESSDVRTLAGKIQQRRQKPAARDGSRVVLTSREKQVLALVAEGRNRRQIAVVFCLA